MTIARRLAEWADNLKYEDLPEKTVHEVKRRMVDSLGTALGAYRCQPPRIVRARAKAVSDMPPASTVWGSRHFVPPQRAAFANGTMVRYLDYNDTYISLESAHPSDNIPAAVAVTQVTGGTGKDLIVATVLGYEIQCRMCDAASLRAGGWDHVIYGAISTALLAAKLWGATVEQMEHALGIAGVCNISIRQTLTGQLADWKGCAFANAARNGICAADLARRGLSGPNEIFEGPRGLIRQLNVPGLAEIVLGGKGDFMIDKTYVKYWPAEYHSQSAIEAVLALRPQIEGKEINEVFIKTSAAAAGVIGNEADKRRPTSRETADHSMPYCCAAALLDGDVTLAAFAEERLTDPKLLALTDKVKIVEDDGLSKEYPKKIASDVTITCTDGTKVNKRVDYPRGHAENPMTDDEIVAKFNRLADGVISSDTADLILEQVWKLDELQKVTPLFAFKILGKKS